MYAELFKSIFILIVLIIIIGIQSLVMGGITATLKFITEPIVSLFKGTRDLFLRLIYRIFRFIFKTFTDQSDIDWSQSITDIDQQLYKKYNLTPEEITYIEATIKPMA